MYSHTLVYGLVWELITAVSLLLNRRCVYIPPYLNVEWDLDEHPFSLQPEASSRDPKQYRSSPRKGVEPKCVSIGGNIYITVKHLSLDKLHLPGWLLAPRRICHRGQYAPAYYS